MRMGMVEGFVDLPSDPQAMKEDSQLAGHRHHRSLLGVLASAFGELETPAAQVTIGSEGPENVLGAADEQATQVTVTGLPGRTPGRCSDPQLGLAVPGLVPLGDETQSGRHLTRLAEAVRVIEGEDICQGGDWTNPRDLAQGVCFRVMLLAELFDLAVVGVDLGGKGGDGLNDGEERGLELWGDGGLDPVLEAIGGAGEQARPRALD
jgi:hypothetical protein